MSQKSLDTIVADSKAVLAGAKGAVASATRLVDELAEDVKQMKLGATGQRVGRLVEGLEERSYQLSVEARITMENLRSASRSLQNLLERLEQDPSSIIFREPPARRPPPRRKQVMTLNAKRATGAAVLLLAGLLLTLAACGGSPPPYVYRYVLNYPAPAPAPGRPSTRPSRWSAWARCP